MPSKKKNLSLLLVLVTSLVGSAAWASEKSVTIFPAEGNKTCSDYASNKLVLSMSVNSPILGTPVTISGTDLSTDGDSLPEVITYTMSADGKTLKFDPKTNTPIDYAVLKSGSAVSVIIYPSGGVSADTNMTIPGPNNTTLPISGFSLCYGLGNTVPTPPEPIKALTPSCSDKMSLDLQGITCDGGAPVLICSIELNQPFFGMQTGDKCCVCNHEALVECDPNLPEGTKGSCPGPTHNEAPKEVTTTIEINKDPYYCTTVGGKKTCYLY